jgi:hypothetical protein|tara:strand:- start:476 stop:889 length:414 start_codon:yes stop_codon:yes gene_type:complete
MKIIGFNFNKISIERFTDKLEELKINTNVDIKNVKQLKQELFHTKEEVVEIIFGYDVDYSPDIAKVYLSGNIILLVDSKTASEFIKEWKNKKIPEKYKLTIFNVILKKSNLKSIQLEDEMNLPLHISLPSVKEIKQN